MPDMNEARKILARGVYSRRPAEDVVTHTDFREPVTLAHEHCGLASCANTKRCRYPTCCASARSGGE